MLWLVTGYSTYNDGIAYAVEAETEEGAYQEVARIRDMKHVRLEKSNTPRSVVVGSGLDDQDEFSNWPVYNLLLYQLATISYESVDNGESFRGYNVIATPLKIGENLDEIVQW